MHADTKPAIPPRSSTVPRESSRLESNQRPLAYKANALTTELREALRMPAGMPFIPHLLSLNALDNAPGGTWVRE